MAGRSSLRVAAPQQGWTDTFFPVGGSGAVSNHLSGFLALLEAVQAGATCRCAHSAMRWAQAQLEWLPGSQCTLPNALARHVAGSLVGRIRFRKQDDTNGNVEVHDGWILAIAQRCHALRVLDLSYCNIGVSDAGLAHLVRLPQLASVSLVYCSRITGTGLAHLAQLPQLASLNLSHCVQVSDAGLAHLAVLPQLSNLNLSYCRRVSDTGAAHLARLPQLTSLNLYHCSKLTDAGLVHLARLSNLLSLNLSYSEACDPGLAYLAARLSKLASLDLHCCTGVTDTGLGHLARGQSDGLSQLTSLNVSTCRVSDIGLVYLARLSQLVSLDLHNCYAVTDAGLAHAAKLLRLTTLNLARCVHVTDAGLVSLAGLTQLAHLNVSDCREVTDAGLLAHASALSRLSVLVLKGCHKVTEGGLVQLRRELPECTCIRELRRVEVPLGPW